MADEFDRYIRKAPVEDDEFAQYARSGSDTPPKRLMDGIEARKPTWFDKIITGSGGGLLSPAKDRGDSPAKRLMEGVGASLGRTTQAWSDALSFNPNERTAAEMIPLIGPAAVDAVDTLSNPETRWEGIGAVGSLLVPAMVHGGVPTPNVAGIKSAVASRVFKVDPHDAVFQAIKPRASKLDFANTLKVAMPDIKAAEVTPITGVSDALDTVRAAKAANRKAYDLFRGPRKEMGTVVDMSAVADSMESSIPHDLMFEASQGVPDAVAAVKAIQTRAAAYRTKIPLQDAENQLMAANARLDEFYAKYPRQQWKSLATNPETASIYAKAESLRNAIYSALDEPNAGSGAREIQSRYGKLLEVEQELQRRKNISDRQQPQSLAQQAGKAHAYGKLALAGGKALMGDAPGAVGSALEGFAMKSASDWMKNNQTSNALIKRAFADYKMPQSLLPVPDPVNIRGLLGAAPRRMPSRIPLALPPASSVSGIGGMEVPEFINRQAFAPKMIEAPQFERGLPPGSPDPFRNPRSLPGDVIEGGSDSFPMSIRPSEIVAPSTRNPKSTAKPEGTRGVPFGRNNPFIKKFRKPEKVEGDWVETDFTGSGPIASLRDDPLGLFNV